MKTKMILTLTALTVTCTLTACGAQKDKTAQLEEQVAQLEQQIKEMQAASQNEIQDNTQTQDDTQNDTLQEGPPTATTTPAATSPATDTTVPAEDPTADTHHAEHDQMPQYDLGTADMSGFAARIDELEQQIKDTTPTGSVQEQGQQFGLLKTEIDSIERELDYTEDDLETQYESGALDAGTYRKLDAEIEALEDRLDRCEDQLELLFGIDD